MVNVPLPKESRRAFACRCYPQLINSLYVYASGHPSQFPGNDSVRGLRAVQMAIGELIGRKLDGMVVIKLQGFVKLIDAIGGIDVVAPRSVYDAKYPLENGSGYVKVFIRAGKQHMNGHKALIYARSRHQDSDYGRMDRQQLVIAAVGKKLLKGDLLGRLPKLLKIAKENLWTNLKTGDLPALATLAEQADLKGMRRIRFIPPTYREFLDRASIKRIRSDVKHAFGKAKPLATPKPTPTPSLVPPLPAY
jgi:LCP family protein required for cell wall assembly